MFVFRVNFDNYIVFFLVVVGNVFMFGFIVIIYYDEVGGNIIGNRLMLIYWNLSRKIRNFKDIIWNELIFIINKNESYNLIVMNIN